MHPLYIGAIVAALLAIGAGYGAYEARAKRRRMLGVETSTTGTLRQLHEAATAAAGMNAFSEIAEVDGTAQPGPGGPLTAPISGTPCVWWRQRVTRRYRDRYTDSHGRRQTREREEEINDDRSRDPFVVRDIEGDIVVVPTTNVQAARKSVSEFRDHHSERQGAQIKVGSFSLSLPSSGDDTIGYEYEEWVLTPETRVFVSGEATDRGGELQIREPQGPYDLVITTKSEEELLGDTHREFLLFGFGAAALAVASVVLLVLAILR
ncbi:MAG TPA: GIDE domain-containing protein [Nocardioides sp.]|jgi:hypothetical protein